LFDQSKAVAFANRGENGVGHTGGQGRRAASTAVVDQECILIGCALEQVMDTGVMSASTFEEEECDDEDDEDDDEAGGRGGRRGSMFAEAESSNEVFFMYELSDHQNIRYFRQHSNERGYSEETRLVDTNRILRHTITYDVLTTFSLQNSH
jgi:hypothetical protein